MLYRLIGCFVFASFLTILLFQRVMASPPAAPKAWTLICYMNGDNDLGDEVLHAVEMLERVGSSDNINVVVMVDAHPGYLGHRDSTQALTQTLYLAHNPQTGISEFKALAPPREQNMADPATLEAFVRTSRTLFPAERYLFATFTHGRGIIDTRNLSDQTDCVVGAICPDDTSRQSMSIDDFSRSLHHAMAGESFEMMVFISCLTNMVEIGYRLRDLTRYMVASPAEIYLLNDPPGQHQIRGLRLERLLATLNHAPQIATDKAAQGLIDDYIAQYNRSWVAPAALTSPAFDPTVQFPGSLSAMDTTRYDALAEALDQLATCILHYLQTTAADPAQLNKVRTLPGRIPRYRSFLNLEYVDLRSMLQEIEALAISDTISLCALSVQQALDAVQIYHRSSPTSDSQGVSIFFPDGRLPSNVLQNHLDAYENTAFAASTNWSRLIRTIHGF